MHQWIDVSAEGQPGTKPLPMCVCQCVVVDLIYVRYSSSLTQASFEYGICVLYVHVRTCGTCERFLVRVASLCMQGGRFNCLRCAARYGRTELFHHLVQKYGCDPKETDRNTTVSHLCTRLHRQLCDLLVFSGHCHSLGICPLSYMCIHVHKCAYIYVHTCVYMYIHVHTCAYMCIHVHTCT